MDSTSAFFTKSSTVFWHAKDNRFPAPIIHPKNFEGSPLSKIPSSVFTSVVCAPYLNARDLGSLALACVETRERVWEVREKHVWCSRVVTTKELEEYVFLPKYIVSLQQKKVRLTPTERAYISNRYKKSKAFEARHAYWSSMKPRFEEILKRNWFVSQMIGLETHYGTLLSMCEVRILTQQCKKLSTLDLKLVFCSESEHHHHEAVIENSRLSLQAITRLVGKGIFLNYFLNIHRISAI